LGTIESITGSYATTGSNTFYGTQVFTGSVYIANDLIVQGSSSIQYISASSVSIGTNIINLNTATPSIRYAGLSIIDSGSSGVSASLLWDSQTDDFIFTHRSSGSQTLDSSMFIYGPLNTGSLDNVVGVLSNRLTKGQNNGTGHDHHITSSQISDDGTTVSIPGALTVTGNITGPIRATNGVVSGSSQVVSIANSQLANSTISGKTLGTNLDTLTIGTGLSGTSYNGSSAVTIANSGVTSIVAGTNISISGGTGAVTITNGVTNNNQLTNGAGYITSAGNAATATTSTNVASPDGDRNPSTKLPTTNARNVRFDFAGAGSVGGTGNYAGVMTYAPWDGTSASTGDSSYQLAFLNETGVNASGVPGLSLRNGINSTWNSWYRIITSGNYGSYAVPLTGGTMTGNLNITGGQGAGNTAAYSSAKRLIFDNDYTTTAKGPNKIILYDASFLAGFGIHTSTVSYYSGDTHKWYKATNADNASIMMQVDGSGNFNATGDVTAYSDIRVKENILNIVDPLNIVLRLRGVSYNRIDTDDKTTKIGFIAQEIEKIVPEVVSYDESEDRYSVSYGNITALLVEAIKEQQIKIDNLTIEVENLKKPKGL
jgi:hypothetical protein